VNRPIDTRATGKKTLANSLVALSSAAVIAVYAAGYARTAPAAGQFVATETVSGGTAGPSPLPTPTPTTAPTATSTPTAAPTTPAQGAAQGAQRPGRQQPGSTAIGGRATPIPPTMATATATAPAPAPAAPATATAAASALPSTAPSSPTGAFRDGTYTGTGTSRHGNIGVTVTVQAGKIVAAEISDCGTRYPCSRIAALPGQAVARQGAAVDVVTGATDSTNAYRVAVNAALAQAR
jgi:uncharacterized protein with FMN-binding domain